MRLLVTGAQGFTGQYFVNIARTHGHDVHELSCDLRDKDTLKACVSEIAPEGVVHLAGISFVGHENISEFYSVNVMGTLNLLDALVALKVPPRSVLLASSANVYGNCQHSPISELQPPQPVNHYGVSKLGMEYLSLTYVDRLPLFFVRPFNYTGPGQSESFIIPKLVKHFAQGGGLIKLGNINVLREFNDVRFVSEAYLRLLTMAKPGDIYNICSGNPITLTSVIDLLKDLSGYSINIEINPVLVRQNEVHRLCGDSTKLNQTIGPIITPTIQDTLQWMLESKSKEMKQCV